MKKYGIMDILTGLMSSQNSQPARPEKPQSEGQLFTSVGESPPDAKRPPASESGMSAYYKYVQRHERISKGIDSESEKKRAEAAKKQEDLQKITQLSRELEIEREKLKLREKQLELFERELQSRKQAEKPARAEAKKEETQISEAEPAAAASEDKAPQKSQNSVAFGSPVSQKSATKKRNPVKKDGQPPLKPQ